MRPSNPKYRLADADAKDLIKQHSIILLEGFDFVKAVNETLEIYERDTRYPTPKEMRDEMNRALIASNKCEEGARIALEGLSDQVRKILARRATIRSQNLESSSLAGLITNGAAVGEGRKRQNGNRSLSWKAELYAPPALQENGKRTLRQRREAEKTLVMNLQIVWLEATGEMPALSATRHITRKDKKYTGAFVRFIDFIFERVGARIYAEPVGIINDLHKDRLALQTRKSSIPF